MVEIGLEDQEVVEINYSQEGREVVEMGMDDQEMADIDWAVGQWEKDTGRAAARRDVGSLDSASGMDCRSSGYMDFGKLHG